MAQNKLQTFGPVALTTSVANILNPPTLTGGVGCPSTTTATYYVVRVINIVNKSASPVTFSMWKGATGASLAGTEVVGAALSVAGNSTFSWVGQMRLDTADFLTATASANTSLTFSAFGEIGIA